MKRHFAAVVFLLAVLSTGSPAAEIETRGVGVYPGDPREDFAPVLVPDTSTYRNLALRRPALQSSAYDYNLTAQLVTDGVRETTPPGRPRCGPRARPRLPRRWPAARTGRSRCRGPMTGRLGLSSAAPRERSPK